MLFKKSVKDSMYYIHDINDKIAQGTISTPLYIHDNMHCIDLLLTDSSYDNVMKWICDIESFFDNKYILKQPMSIHIPYRYTKIDIPIETKNNKRLLMDDLTEGTMVNVKLKPVSAWIDSHELQILFNASKIVANIEYV